MRNIETIDLVMLRLRSNAAVALTARIAAADVVPCFAREAMTP
jgi:hypothetical protein